MPPDLASPTYRRLGYDYALDLHGARVTYLSLIPQAPAEAPEPYGLRPAVVADIPAISALYERGYTSGAVWTVVPEEYWRYQIGLWDEPAFRDAAPTVSPLRWRLYTVVRATGEAVGYAMLATKRWGPEVGVHALEIGAEASLSEVMPSLLRALAAYAADVPAVSPDAEPVRAIAFELGRAHPVYDVLADRLAPGVHRPYAWYVRVSDVAAFLRRVTEVLDRRLAASSMAGYTGDLEIDLYEGGVRLVFEAGRLARVGPWRAPLYNRSYAVGFPPLVFPQLLLGYRSLDELRDTYPDVIARGEVEPLLRALFPARHSRVMPL